MKYRLTFEFDYESDRNFFLATLSDGNGAQAFFEAFDMNGNNIHFDYSKAFKAWGWNGIGDPVVTITTD